MSKKRIGGLTAIPLALGLLASFTSAQPASAAVRSWVPSVSYPYPGNWHCTEQMTASYSVDVCLINSHNGVEPVYKAVMIVWNFRATGFQMSSAVINMWALPNPARQIRDDACYNSGLSGGYHAACFGTAAARSTVCSLKPGASSLTANGAIDIPAVSPTRITVVSPAVPVIC